MSITHHLVSIFLFHFLPRNVGYVHIEHVYTYTLPLPLWKTRYVLLGNNL
jgi:hypothetical protein